MNSFKAYKDIIAEALGNNVSKKPTNTSKKLITEITEAHLRQVVNGEVSISNDLVKVAKDMRAKQIDEQAVGHHPDFKYLNDPDTTKRKTEEHYIVSVFIDVEGSTNLFKKYDKETVLIITNTIQLAAISVCKLFGGFIHRLQGDGLFVYFGGRTVDESLANIHALTALSFFNYFLENDLKNLFNEQDIEKINAKVGIDFGKKENVLWAMAGIGESSEITTTSLHTSLASKMQQFAGSNEIIIGENVVKQLAEVVGNCNDLLKAVKEKKYIFEDGKGFKYRQYKFNWSKFLTDTFQNVNPDNYDVCLREDLVFLNKLNPDYVPTAKLQIEKLPSLTEIWDSIIQERNEK